MSVAALGLLAAYLAAIAVTGAGIPAIELSHTGLAWSVAWFAGERTRLRRAQLAELRARATGLEQDARRDRRLAVAEERARIARDLHDSAGHAVNVIAVRAGAARLRHGQEPDRSVTALEAIEELARRMVDDIDHIGVPCASTASHLGASPSPSGCHRCTTSSRPTSPPAST